MINNLKTACLFVVVMTILVTACSQENKTILKDKDSEIDLVISSELSNQHVTAIAEDSRGYIWIGTFRGLNRYNGHEYHQYFCTDDSVGLQDNQIKSLFVDSKKRLWVGTINGACIYTSQDEFKRIAIPKGSKNCLKFIEDRKGRIFLFTLNELMVYDEKTMTFNVVKSALDKRQQYVGNILIDEMGDFWAIGINYITHYRAGDLKQIETIECQETFFSLK